ncbi:MAG: MFS transporter [Clostridiales bacterium]|nr:MFS transporter [Clostridiales bacterium]
MNNKNRIAVTIYTVSIMQMSALAVSAALSDISAQFPNVPTTTIQMIMSLPSLIMCVSTLISGQLARVMQKKYIIAIATAIVAASGVAGLLFHGSIGVLLMWAIILGFGIGLFMPQNSSIIALNFDDEKRGIISGRQVTAATVGGMALSALAGVLCSGQWYYVYFVYLLAIPGLICSLCFLPADRTETVQQKQQAQKGHVSGRSWIYIAAIFLFICVYNIIPNNLTMYITEKGIGNSTVAGLLTSVFLLGGAVAGIVYGGIGKYLQDKIIPVAFFLVIAGSLTLFLTNSLPLVFIGVFVAGTSVSFVMSQCVCRLAVVERPENMTLAMAFLMAANSLAQSIAPVFTKLSAIVFRTEDVVHRFLLIAVLGAILLCVTGILLRWEKRMSA